MVRDAGGDGDGEADGDAMLDAWTGLGLDAGVGVRGGGDDDDDVSRFTGRVVVGFKGRCGDGRRVLYEGGRLLGFV